jgi:hypothetical protein
MKTLNILNNLLKVYNEADATIPQPDAQPQEGQPVPAPAAEAPVEAPVEETKPLTSSGEVFLLNMLKKALVIDPDDTDLNELDMMGDITETNAAEMRQKLLSMMKDYTIDLNINV